MDQPEGAGSQRSDRLDFDPCVRLEFRGTQLSSDGGLLVMRELDGALGLSGLASMALSDNRRGKNNKVTNIAIPGMPGCDLTKFVDRNKYTEVLKDRLKETASMIAHNAQFDRRLLDQTLLIDQP